MPSASKSIPACQRAAETVGSKLSRPTIFSTSASTRSGAVTKAMTTTLPGAFQIVAVEPAQRQPAAGEALQQQRAHMGLVGTAAGHRYQVTDLDLARDQRLPIDEGDDRPQQQIDEQDETGATAA